MKLEIHLLQPQLRSRVIQALSDAKLLDKVQLSVVSDSSPSRHSKLTLLPTRSYQVESRADGTLWLKDSGKQLPAMSGGKLDRDRLVREMLLPSYTGH